VHDLSSGIGFEGGPGSANECVTRAGEQLGEPAAAFFERNVEQELVVAGERIEHDVADGNVAQQLG